MPNKRRFVPAVLVTLVLLSAASNSQTFSVLYNFGSVAGDPTNPGQQSVIAQGRDGALFSTSPSSFTLTGLGPMFRITPAGAISEPFSSFTRASLSGLTLGTNGNFYGTTFGGTGSSGILYELTPSGALSTLHTFDTSDGSNFYAPPIQGTDGNLYGVSTQGGGATSCGYVYKLALPSNTYTVLHQFQSTDGCEPLAPLVQGTDGNFYGTTNQGGAHTLGVIFRITPGGKLTVLHNFDTSFGSPYSPLIQASDGNFYGTATGGLKFAGGAIFKISPTGKFGVLHGLNGTTDGNFPLAGLVQATDGNFYGTAVNGGTVISSSCTLGCGTIFRVTPAGVFKVIYNFDGPTGEFPQVTLLQHTNGILYADTSNGGTGGTLTGICAPGNCGVFYSVNIGAAPFVSLVSNSGKAGKTVEILGQGFTGTTAVSFGSTGATFNVVSDTYLTATVPAGARTTAVTVTTPGGSLKSNKAFRVTPQITSFNPPNGPVGTPVTITGVSLTQATKVTFGGVAATSFTVNSDTQVTATVPTGAVTGKIAITTPGGTAASATSFTVN